MINDETYDIAILMSTYNSCKYLEQQIQSLRSQTYSNWNLFVRDDISTDSTPQMLQEYAKTDHRITVVADSKKRGPMDGFMWLLKQVDAQYYMFCDHDDVWMPDKIERSMTYMEQHNNHDAIPMVVCCDLEIVNEQLQTIDSSFWANQHYDQSLLNNKFFHLFYNNIPGCSMLFNRKARALALPYPPQARMHDAWIVASVLWNDGKVIPIADALIKYRQHGNNTIGANDVPSFGSQLRKFWSLCKKTYVQYKSMKPLCKLDFISFFIIKLRYMAELHIAS